IDGLVLYVADDADDFHRTLANGERAGRRAEPHVLPDRVLARPEAARTGFVHDGDGRRTRAVRRRQRPSGDAWNAQRPEVVARDVVAAHTRRARRINWLSRE